LTTFNLPKGGFLSGSVRVIGKEAIEAKLAVAEANILANNLAMTKEMLGYVKAEVVPQIPIGPGHFGYHLRETFSTDVKAGRGQGGTKVTGVLRSAVQGYWRERGTRRGERAYMTAHKALAGVKKFINAYYGMAKWWHG